MTDIAIIGIDCRFPKAPDPAALWDLLMRGGEGVTEIPESRWDAGAYHDPDGGPGTSNTRHAGFIDDADAFDHEFFGFSEAEAEISDPQVRLLLETAWRALEDATLDPRAQAGSRTGVYVGVMWSHWTSLLVADPEAFTGHAGAGTGFAMTANRISHFLDLTGPSMAIDTACSSALVAAEHACAALRTGICDQALVGAANIFLTPASNIHHTQAKVSAPDGRSKPFSAAADGFGSAEGVGVLVLRRLSDAVAEGLPVYAVIKGGAINHGGRSMTVTSPNPAAQQAVMNEAYERSGVLPRDVAFVEAHGTGTPVGDRLEARALGRVHGVPRDEPCAIGSVKGNIGHTEGAAGMAGLIKTALALHHRVLPASRFAEDENPRLRLERGGLRLTDAPLKLHAGTVVGAVSAFGWGGTNAHLVLATAPPSSAPGPRGEEDGGVLTVSAPNAEALRGAVRRIAADVAARPDVPLAELTWTSNKVKASGRVRFALPVRDRARALADLTESLEFAEPEGSEGSEGPAGSFSRAAEPAGSFAGLAGSAGAVSVGWLFPAADAGLPAMSRNLYGRSAAYRRALDEVDAVLMPHLGRSVRDKPLDGVGRPDVFAVAYALGRTLLDLGITPAWMLAEGPGEYAAAALSGTLDLADACRLAAALEEPAASPWLATAITVRRPDIPLYSALRGRALGDDALDPAYWGTQAGPSERSDDALRAALDTEPSHLIEIVPGRTPVEPRTLQPLSPTGDGLLHVVAELYRAGLDPDWDALYEPDRRVRHRLTPYEFAATGRFWWNRVIATKAAR
jgi:acyl transferase domain-containing protein